MVTRSTKIQEAVKTLLKVQGELKELALAERELKDEIKAYMGTERVLEAGEGFVTLETRTRTDLDKNKLIYDLGAEVIKKYQKQCTYEVMTVRPTQVGIIINKLGG